MDIETFINLPGRWCFLVTAFVYAIDYVKPRLDYADFSLKPDYAETTCSKPDNADHCYGPMNIKYTSLVTWPDCHIITGYSFKKL